MVLLGHNSQLPVVFDLPSSKQKKKLELNALPRILCFDR